MIERYRIALIFSSPASRGMAVLDNDTEHKFD